MKNFPFIIIAIIILSSCTKKCHINGNITNADGNTIYLIHKQLKKSVIIDSAKLDKKGKFKFCINTSKYPDFYKIKLQEQYLMLAVDSTTKEININVSANDFYNPIINGSDESNIILKLRQSSYKLQAYAKEKQVDSIENGLNKHKKLAQTIILKNPSSASAYYAINQTINGHYYFSPFVKEDLPFWSAVATAYDIHFPQYDRSIDLKRTTLLAIKESRQKSITIEDLIKDIKIEGFIDIELPNRFGNIIKLSSLLGKVVLIDFSAYEQDYSPVHNLFLREIYNKYKELGMEIYQISLDINKETWIERSKNIPWICVRDVEAPNSKYLYTYNVTKIPTLFVMNKKGDIVGRCNYENVEETIKNLLKQ